MAGKHHQKAAKQKLKVIQDLDDSNDDESKILADCRQRQELEFEAIQSIYVDVGTIQQKSDNPSTDDLKRDTIVRDNRRLKNRSGDKWKPLDLNICLTPLFKGVGSSLGSGDPQEIHIAATLRVRCTPRYPIEQTVAH